MKSGWQEKALGEILQETETINPLQSPSAEFEYVDVSSVSNVTFQVRETQRLKGAEAPSRARRLIRANDVLFATVRPTLQRIAIVPGRLDNQVCSTGYFVLRPKNEVDHRFVFYFLFTNNFMKQMENLQKGASYPAVTDGDMRAQIMPIPPLFEQRRIVETLDKAFDGIATAKAHAEKNLQNSNALLQSRLNAIFAKRGEGWVEKTLESCCEQIFAGGDVPKDRLSQERTLKYSVPIFSNGEKDNGLYGFTDVARVTKPSITVSARGTLGFTVIRTEPFLPVVRLIVLVPDEKLIMLSFLYYAVVGMDFGNTGTSIPQLTVPNFKESKLSVPSLLEQKVIVEELDELREETKRLEYVYQQKSVALDELKRSILKKAFEGDL
jgi:type I restriction enzyme S subunit